MSLKDSRGTERYLGARAFGDPLGEAVLHRARRYRRTAIAQGPVSCLAIGGQQLLQVVGEERLKFWEELVSESVVELLKKIDLLSGLQQQWMYDLLASHFIYRPFEAGQTIVEYAVPDDRSMFIICRGQVLLHMFPSLGFTPPPASAEAPSASTSPTHAESGPTKKADEEVTNTQHIKTVTLEPGSYFGESALIVDIPRNITAVTLTSGLLLELRESSFRQFLSLVPELQGPFQELTKARMAEQIRGANIEMFQYIPKDRFTELACTAELVRFLPGDVILKHGEIGSHFYLILNGQVSGLTADGQYLGSLGPGQCFGERSWLGSRPRTTSIVARTVCSLFAFSRAQFHAMFNVDRILDRGSLTGGSKNSNSNSNSDSSGHRNSSSQLSRPSQHGSVSSPKRKEHGEQLTQTQAQSLINDESERQLHEMSSIAAMVLRFFADEAPVMAFLANPDARGIFMQFCEKECSTENLCFYTAVETYRKLSKALNQAISFAEKGMITPPTALILIGQATVDATAAFCGPEGDEALAMKRAAAAAEQSLAANERARASSRPSQDADENQASSATDTEQKKDDQASASPGASLRRNASMVAQHQATTSVTSNDIELKLVTFPRAHSMSVSSPDALSPVASSKMPVGRGPMAFQLASQSIATSEITRNSGTAPIDERPESSNAAGTDSDSSYVEFASWRLETTAPISTQLARLKDIASSILFDAAQKIWYDYIAPGEAEFEVNLQGKNITAIQSAIESGIVTETTFDSAQSEIIFLMQDTLTRFRQSSLYNNILQHFPRIEIAEEFKHPPEHSTAGRSSTRGSQLPVSPRGTMRSLALNKGAKNEVTFLNPLSDLLAPSALAK